MFNAFDNFAFHWTKADIQMTLCYHWNSLSLIKKADNPCFCPFLYFFFPVFTIKCFNYAIMVSHCYFNQTIKKKTRKLLLCLLETSGFQMHISGRRLNRDLKLSLLTKSRYRMLKLVTKIPEEGWVDIHMMILINSTCWLFTLFTFNLLARK